MRIVHRASYSQYTGKLFDEETLLNDLLNVYSRQSLLKPYSTTIIFKSGKRLEICCTGVESWIKNPSPAFLEDVVKKYMSRKKVSVLQVSDLHCLSIDEEGNVSFQLLLGGIPIGEKNEKYVEATKNKKEFKRVVKKWEKIASKLEVPHVKNMLRREEIPETEVCTGKLRKEEILPYTLKLLKSLNSLNSKLVMRYKLPIIQQYVSELIIQPKVMRLWSSYDKEDLEFALSLLDLKEEPEVEVRETERPSSKHSQAFSSLIAMGGCGNEVRRLNIYWFQKQKRESF